jgi:hypothetical protein
MSMSSAVQVAPAPSSYGDGIATALDDGFAPSAQKPLFASTTRTSSKPAAASISASPFFSCLEWGGEPERQPAAALQHAPDLSEAGQRVPPDLH